jgi:deazaflavin-dependent oxidoreductase (nitroreductase family)
MKHQIVHALQKYVLNPPIKGFFAIGIVPPGYALLETIGRKTGKVRRTPVGDALVGRQFWIVAEHGMKAGYVRNIAANPRVRLKLREGLRARWHTPILNKPTLFSRRQFAEYSSRIVNAVTGITMRIFFGISLWKR